MDDMMWLDIIRGLDVVGMSCVMTKVNTMMRSMMNSSRNNMMNRSRDSVDSMDRAMDCMINRCRDGVDSVMGGGGDRLIVHRSQGGGASVQRPLN